jgi:cysteine desulfurase / selenocysteine lyase
MAAGQDQGLIDWAQIRAQFPALQHKTFLNSATMGQLPIAASEAVMAHLQRRDYVAAVDAPRWFDDLDRLRAKLATLVHATPADIGFVPSTSHALSIVTNGIDWQPGDEILTLENEFPNNTYAGSLLTRRGVIFRETPLADFASSVTPRTRLVLVSALSYLNGMRAPLADIRQMAPNAFFYVDATQGCGAIEINAPALGIDMLAVHGYKWMLSPTGAGFLYVKPEVRQWLEPNVIGWRSHHNWRDWSNLHHGTPEFSPAAERYEACFPAMPLYYAMEQSVDLFLSLGPATIEQRVLTLADQLRTVVRNLGGTVAYENSPTVCCRFPGLDSGKLSTDLLARNIIVSARHGWLRVSVHLYNNEADLEHFAAGVKAALDA